MTQADHKIASIATRQLGAFTRAQAHDVGLTDRQLGSRVLSGFLVQVGPNAFRSAGAPTTTVSSLRELVLDIGDPVWVANTTAAALHGFDGFALQRPFHLLVPRARSVNRWNVRVHRTDCIDPIDRCDIGGLPVTSAVRTLIDLARGLPAERLASSIDSALRDGKISEDLLHERIVRLRTQGRFGLPLLAEVLAGHEVTRGGHSWLERRYLKLLASAGLPAPTMQPVLAKSGGRLIRVDCCFPGTNVVVELLGYRFHRTRTQMERDTTRMNALLEKGFRPYQFTYGQIVSETDYVVSTTRVALT